MTASQATPERARHLAFIHRQAKMLKLVPKSDGYRAWLKRRTGAESCRDLDDAALAALADSLKPTRNQWRRCYRLATAIGFTDLNDAGFLTFMAKITGETQRWHLSRQQLNHLLIALGKWLEHRAKQAGATLAAPPAPADVGREPLPVVVDSDKKKAPAVAPRQGLPLSTSPAPASILEPSSVALETLPR
jgi:hypothetical protein